MILSDTITVVFSEVEIKKVFSEEDQDYRSINENLRITEDNEVRITEGDNKRILE